MRYDNGRLLWRTDLAGPIDLYVTGAGALIHNNVLLVDEGCLIGSVVTLEHTEVRCNAVNDSDTGSLT